MNATRPNLTERTAVIEQKLENQDKRIERLISEVHSNTEEMRKMSITYSRVNSLFNWVGKVVTALLIGWLIWLIKTKF